MDQKLWVAIACPTTGLEFDAHTLTLIDTDKDGRIRPPELIAAIKWATNLLKNPDILLKGEESLPLDEIDQSKPEGKQVYSSIKQLLATLGKPDAQVIIFQDVAQASHAFAQSLFNGDGVITPEAAEDEETRAVINDIIACLRPDQDRSGKPGVSQAKVEKFFTEAAALLEWWAQAENNQSVFLLGDETPNAAAAVKAVKTKVDDFFARCRLAAFDPRAIDAINPKETDYLTLASPNLTITAAEIAAFPLAQAAPGKPLPLLEGVNPAWAEALKNLYALAVKPLLGDKKAISEDDWIVIQKKLEPYEAWLTRKPNTAVEKLGPTRLREILAGNYLPKNLRPNNAR